MLPSRRTSAASLSSMCVLCISAILCSGARSTGTTSESTAELTWPGASWRTFLPGCSLVVRH
ncbi:hypothetical protein [Achromobacter phage tuull]|nr:hypothetical protein [Achromobacter phage tuull]